MFRDEVHTRSNVSWSQLARYLAKKGERAVPRVTYLDGVLELVSPARGHEKHGAWIGALVAMYALERGIELSAYGSWTLKDELKRAGAEPDECFILGDDKGKRKRPHFAIEIQWSRKGIDKLEVYKRLGVREVWFWVSDALAVYVLKRGKFVEVERSAALPDLDLELRSFLDRPTMTTAMREYRAALAPR